MLLATHVLIGRPSLALLKMHPVPNSLLVINIIVIQATQPVHYNYSMGSSVKAPAAPIPTLSHGSVYSFLLQ